MATAGTIFTERRIQTLKAKDKPYLESEPGGLYLRVRPSGRKVFMTVYTWDGKQRWLTVGRYPEITVKQAREQVREVQARVESGIDPTAEKQMQKTERVTAPTVAEFADIYIERWSKPKKKSAKEDRRILDVYIVPVIGKRKIKDLTRAEVIHLLDDVAERGPIMANRTLAVIRKMLNFAVNRAVIELSPCQNISPPGKEQKKQRALSDDEIQAVWSIMTEKVPDQTCRAIKTILATAQRPGEVASMEWAEIDGRWWTIPVHKTKNGKEHRVYLSDLALSLIGEKNVSRFVFPSKPRRKQEKDQPLSHNAFTQAIRRHNSFGVAPFTGHDLRRTAGTHISSLGYDRTILQKILNHTDGSVTAVYDRYSYDKEKTTALEAWGRKLEILAGQRNTDNVVHLRSNTGSENRKTLQTS